MHIMAVDDEQLALDYLKVLLLRHSPKHNITCFNSASEALSYLKSEGQTTETVFLDMEMPDMQGLKLAEEISEINPKIEIIFLTGHREFAVEAFELGVKDYLIKPLSFDRLEKALSRLDNRKEQVIETAPQMLGNTFHLVLKDRISITDPLGNSNEIRWRTGKAREVFLYLLHYQKRTVSKTEILDIFWTDFPIEKAYSQLYTIIYHIRKTFKDYSDNIKLMNIDDGYRLLTSDVTIDIIEWKKTLKQAEKAIESQNTLELQNSLSYYQGDYLTYSSFLWAEEERQQQQALWRDKSIKLASYFESHHQIDVAVELYNKVLHRHPLDEDIHLLLMQLYAKNKQTGEVNNQFQKLKSLLDDELGVNPDPSVLKWYEKWLNRN